MALKLCNIHGLTKHRQRNGGKKHAYICKRCHADKELRRKAVKYGADPSVLNTSRCESCGDLPTGTGRDGILCLDHNHQTGKYRGMLCRSCNLAIGFLSDDPVRCELAAEYLRQRNGA
jgi:hypothetical protein